MYPTVSPQSSQSRIKTIAPDSAVAVPDSDWTAHVASRLQFGGRPESAIAPDPATLEPGCTVAICTYQRASALARFLDSLAVQHRRPERLVIVDASHDDQTERALQERIDHDRLADEVLYFHVSGPLRGLTRQRNFALRWVATDLVAFFDDDVGIL